MAVNLNLHFSRDNVTKFFQEIPTRTHTSHQKINNFYPYKIFKLNLEILSHKNVIQVAKYMYVILRQSNFYRTVEILRKKKSEMHRI